MADPENFTKEYQVKYNFAGNLHRKSPKNASISN